MQDACLALLVANDRFDPSRSSWKTFAYRRADGAMVDAMRSRAETWPREQRKRRRQIAITKDQLRADLMREPTGDEVATALGWTNQEYERRTAHIAALEGLAAEHGDRATGVVPEWCRRDTPDASDDAEREQKHLRLRQAITRLEPRDRWIAERYYFGELTMQEIADEIGVNESRVSQLHARMLTRLKDLL